MNPAFAALRKACQTELNALFSRLELKNKALFWFYSNVFEVKKSGLRSEKVSRLLFFIRTSSKKPLPHGRGSDE